MTQMTYCIVLDNTRGQLTLRHEGLDKHKRAELDGSPVDAASGDVRKENINRRSTENLSTELYTEQRTNTPSKCSPRDDNSQRLEDGVDWRCDSLHFRGC